jgi:hypothetical protein
VQRSYRETGGGDAGGFVSKLRRDRWLNIGIPYTNGTVAFVTWKTMFRLPLTENAWKRVRCRSEASYRETDPCWNCNGVRPSMAMPVIRLFSLSAVRR